MFLVQRRIAQEHKEVIQVNYNCNIKVKPEQPINIGLKAGGGVCWPKWHHQVFKLSVSCSKSGLPLISLSDLKAIVGILHINFAKNSSTIEAVKYLINQGKRVSIFYCHGV